MRTSTVRNQVSSIRWAVLAAVALAGVSEQAQAVISPRAAFTLGPWKGDLTQTLGTQKVTLSTATSLGFDLAVGLSFGDRFFIDYNLTWLAAPSALRSPARASDASYWSFLGGSLGVSLPGIPLDPYLGAEAGNYGFVTGANAEFSGTTFKAGLILQLADPGGRGAVAIRAEYRRIWLDSDQGGTLPDEVNTTAHAYFVGLMLGTF